MKILYDAEVDVLSIVFIDTTVTTKYIEKGIAVDYAADGQLAGIEILAATKQFGGKNTLQQIVLEGVGLAL